MAEAVAQAVANMAAGDNRAEGSSVGDACEGGNQAGQESRHDGRVVVARHRQIHGSIVLTLEPYDGLFVYREALKRSEDSPEPRLGRLVFNEGMSARVWEKDWIANVDVDVEG